MWMWSLGIAYLHLFLTQRDAAHDTRADNLVRFRVSLIFGLENSVVLRAAVARSRWLERRVGGTTSAAIHIPRPTPFLTS